MGQHHLRSMALDKLPIEHRWPLLKLGSASRTPPSRHVLVWTEPRTPQVDTGPGMMGSDTQLDQNERCDADHAPNTKPFP